MQIIIDFDGTLTAEETQAAILKEKSLHTLADEFLNVPYKELAAHYAATQKQLRIAPHQYWWEVNGLIASYCDEGAFILNTTTLQVMLHSRPAYMQALEKAFPEAEYDPVMDCVNHLFHRHTAEIPPAFRPAARGVLNTLLADPSFTPVILTNSLSDKVCRLLGTLALDNEIDVLGDTRQYEMIPDWPQHFRHPNGDEIQVWEISEKRQIDLRRPIYYRALRKAQKEFSHLAVVADTLSLPGAMPMLLGIPFFLLRTSYTPEWCIRVVQAHPFGRVLDKLAALPQALVDLTGFEN